MVQRNNCNNLKFLKNQISNWNETQCINMFVKVTFSLSSNLFLDLKKNYYINIIFLYSVKEYNYFNCLHDSYKSYLLIIFDSDTSLILITFEVSSIGVQRKHPLQ